MSKSQKNDEIPRIFFATWKTFDDVVFHLKKFNTSKVRVEPRWFKPLKMTTLMAKKKKKKTMPLNCTIKMVKMVNFSLCIFYHNKKC